MAAVGLRPFARVALEVSYPRWSAGTEKSCPSGGKAKAMVQSTHLKCARR